TGGPPPAGTTAEASCDRYYDALHAFARRCSTGSYKSNVPADVAHDKERFRTICVDGFHAPGTSITPETMTACAAALDASTDCLAPGQGDGQICNVGPGSLDDGSPCMASGAQCKGYCKSDDASFLFSCGHCAPRSPSGGACETSPQCPSGQ